MSSMRTHERELSSERSMEGVGLGFHRNAGTPEFFPGCDDHERQQHGVDDAHDGVDEACNVVLLLTDRRWHQALDQRQSEDRGQASPTNHQKAIKYAHRQRSIPPFGYCEIAGGTQDTCRRVYKQTKLLRKPGEPDL